MSLQPAAYDRKIAFERGTQARSGLGKEPLINWALIGQSYARVLFGSGQERRTAGAEGASQAATFRAPSSSTTRAVIETDRIQFDGRAWNITSIAPIGVNDDIEFTAVAAGRSEA